MLLLDVIREQRDRWQQQAERLAAHPRSLSRGPQPSDGRMTQNRNALVGTYLSRSADVGTTIRRDHIVDLIVGNWHPFAIDFDFVVVTNHATLGRATIHQVAARSLAMPAFPLVSALGSPSSPAGRSALFAGFASTMTESDCACPCIIGYASSPSRCGPPYARANSQPTARRGISQVPKQSLCALRRVKTRRAEWSERDGV